MRRLRESWKRPPRARKARERSRSPQAVPVRIRDQIHRRFQTTDKAGLLASQAMMSQQSRPRRRRDNLGRKDTYLQWQIAEQVKPICLRSQILSTVAAKLSLA